MDRREQYKHSNTSTEAKRSRRREREAELRKDKREKILSSKRVRFSELEAGEVDEDFSAAQVQELAVAIRKSDPTTLNSLRSLRKAFAQGSEFISVFLGVENSLRSLVGHLTGNNAQLQLEAAWCITNLAAGTHEDTLKVLKASSPYLITYLSGQNVELQDQCAWALGNMSGDSQECREILQAQGIVLPMVKLLKCFLPTVVQSAAFALSNLCRGQAGATDALMQEGVAATIVDLLTPGKNPVDVTSELAWLLTYILSHKHHVPTFVQLGVINRLVQNLHNFSQETPHNSQVITPILRSLGNIASGPNENGTMALQGGILLEALSACLQSTHRHIKKESLWVISNLTAGPREHAMAVAGAGLIPLMVELLSSSYDIKSEAAICVCNMAHHGPDFIQQILHCNATEPFINILKSPDPDTITMGLQFFEMAFRNFSECRDMFEQAEGVACLEALEYNCNPDISGPANELLDTYFMEEENEEGAEGGSDPSLEDNNMFTFCE